MWKYYGENMDGKARQRESHTHKKRIEYERNGREERGA